MKLMKILPIAAILIATIGLATANDGNNQWRSISPRQKLSAVEAAIKGYYVDTVDENKIVEAAIVSMLNELDPHSVYSDKEETKALTEPLDGNFSGIGIQYNMQTDTVYVLQTIAGGPCEKVGIRPGDKIIEVNDTVIAGKKLKTTDVVKRLRGPKGSMVKVKVKRRGTVGLIEFYITRDDIPINSIDAAYMVDDKTGYIRINKFARSTGEEFEKALKKLKKHGMKQLVLDLTDNGGGYLDAACQLANEFLQKNELMVYTQGRTKPRSDMFANGFGRFRKEKLVVMVNQFSASASEILSGALQDWDRAPIVGRRTFGKGLVQHPIVFPDGTMMRLSIARYYTPSGRSIQKPYTKGDKESYENDLIDRYNHGEMNSADSTSFNESMKFTTLKKKRTVFGGGGIMPDVFVPLDTTAYSDYYRDLMAKGIPNKIMLDYIDLNRDNLKKQYKDVVAFDQSFTVSEDLMQKLIAEGEKEKVKFNEEQYNTSKNVLQTLLKGLVARDIFGTEAYFYIVNNLNDIYLEAIKLINDDERFNQIVYSEKK